MPSNSLSPFKFLDSYSIGDLEIFYGRENESKQLYKKFFSSNLLILYGKSGTGKSSLVNCGLMANIPPEDAMLITVRCGEEPFNNLIQSLKEKASINSNDELTLIENIFENNFKPLAFVFDQFEEIFIVAESSKRNRFIKALVNILKYKDIKSNVIISIREEYLANLTALEEHIPNLFDNRFWLKSIKKESIQEIIEKPCKKCNVKVEKGLPDLISEKFETDLDEIELTYFQILMDSLYRKAVERNPKSPELKIDDFRNLGSLENLLGDFMNHELTQIKDVVKVETILKALVTEEGTKKLITIAEIVRCTLIKTAEVKSIIYELIRKRIITDKNDKEQYELKHDILAKRIYSRISEDEKKAREALHLIKNRLKDFKKTKTYLDQETLDFIQPHLKNIILSKEEIWFIKKSQNKVFDVKNKRVFYLAAIVIVPIIIIIYILSLNINKKKSKIRELNYKNEALIKETRATIIEKMESDFIDINGGDYYYGLQPGDSIVDSTNLITVDDFCIQKHETSFQEYKMFCEETGRILPVEPQWGWSDSYPIVNINWNDANDFCAWFSQITRQTYRLPTEAEYEYASKGGKKSLKYIYSGSNYAPNVAVFKTSTPSVICSKSENELGIYDLSGNVREWCSNWYYEDINNPDYNPNDNSNSTIAENNNSYKAVRGGAFSSDEEMLKITSRFYGRYDAVPDENGMGLHHFGFRCVREKN